jgi:hypothetical protein
VISDSQVDADEIVTMEYRGGRDHG